MFLKEVHYGQKDSICVVKNTVILWICSIEDSCLYIIHAASNY